MPIEIPAGETYQFDVIVRTLAAGDSQFEFNLFIEANNALYIQPVKADISVLPSAEQDGNQAPSEDPKVDSPEDPDGDSNEQPNQAVVQ